MCIYTHTHMHAIFSQVLASLYIFLVMSFEEKFLILIKPNYLYFPVVHCALEFLINLCLPQVFKDIFRVFFRKFYSFSF